MNRLVSILLPPPPSNRASLGLLVLRVVAGASMMTHGWGKIQDPFSWMGKTDSPPAVFQFLAAFSEFFGGLALILGALTVLAAFGVMCTMVVAINHHVGQSDPYGKWELAALYLVIAIAMMLAGPGRFSIDALLQRRAAAARSPGTGAG